MVLHTAFARNGYLCGKCRTNGTVGFHKDVFAGKHSYGCERQPPLYIVAAIERHWEFLNEQITRTFNGEKTKVKNIEK